MIECFKSIMPAPSAAQEVSLFGAALPSQVSKEGNSVFDSLRIPAKGKPAGFQNQYRCNLILARLILEICQETAEDIQNRRFSHFDALLRNFGCQITALQNHRLLKNKGLLEEAARVHQIASANIKKTDAFWAKPPIGENGMEVTDYLKRIDVDVQISPEMAQLVRFKILNVINTNVLFNGRELPKTDTDPIVRRINEIATNFNRSQFKQYGIPKCHAHWIAGLQAEEAEAAVSYIQKVGAELADSRADLVQRMLQEKHKRASTVRGSGYSPIVSLPQLYTGEASLKGVKGIVLVKNKMTLCGMRIRDADLMQTYVKMPENRVLTQAEVMEIPDWEALVVLEGYIPNAAPLEEKVKELGVVTLLTGTLARLPQYASGTPGDFDESAFNDPEAQRDLEQLKMHEAYNVIQVDHMYCSSMKEERVLKSRFNPEKKP